MGLAVFTNAYLKTFKFIKMQGISGLQRETAMNSEMNLLSSEITHLRDALRNLDLQSDAAELERLQRDLMFTQSKLLIIEIDRPTSVRDCGISLAYH